MVDSRFGNVVEKLKNFNNMQDQKTAQEIAEQNEKAQMDAIKQTFIQESRKKALDVAQYIYPKTYIDPIQPRVTEFGKDVTYDLLVEAEKIYQWLIAVTK